MNFFKNKRGKIAVETLIKLLLLTVFLVIALSLFWMIHTEMRPNIMSEYSCWMTNGLRQSSVVFKATLPRSCEFKRQSEPAELKDISRLLRTAWWMYGKGRWDIYSDVDDTRTVVLYSFRPDKRISLKELGEYLMTHRRGERVTDMTKSDFSYIQGGSLGNTLCLGKDIADTLAPDIEYFVIFYDDREYNGARDKLIISTRIGMAQDWGSWINPLKSIFVDVAEDRDCKGFSVIMTG